MRRLMLRAVSAGLWIATAFATLLLAAAFLPTLFGLKALIVTSGSMGKALPIGSVALTRPIEAQAIAVGDMISFRYRGEGETITHRVIAIDHQIGQFAFTTKGDANSSPDPEKVVVALRVHHVERIIPYAGYVIRYARTPQGAIVLILLPIVGLTLDRRHRGHTRAPRSARPRGPRKSDELVFEAGWSTTTYHLVRVSPRGLGSDAGG